MSIPKGGNSTPQWSAKGGFTVSWTTAALGAVLGMALAGTAGFYIGKNQVAIEQNPVPATATPQQQARHLPKGVTRLPTKTFGKWNLNCLQNAQKQQKCELVLRAVDQARKALVLSLAVVRNPKGEPVLVVITPPNATLSAGVRLVPEASAELKAGFAACRPGACQAEVTLTDAAVAALSSAGSLQVSYVGGGGRTISYKLPNAGFREGYEAWQAS